MSNPIIIGIDHGYSNIKTARFVFPAGVVEYTHEPYSMNNVLEYHGKYYVIGSGRQFLQRDKTMTDSYYLMTLAAIAMELEYRQAPADCSVILAAGLPLTEYGRDREKFEQYLCKGSMPVDFRYAGRAYHITIEEVKLFPQGYAAVLTQPELLEEPSVIVADIGGWTVDLMQVDNRLPNAATCRSLELGVIRCLDEISEKIRRSLGLSMTGAQIEAVLRSEATEMDDQAKEIIHATTKQYVFQLLSAIRQSGLDYSAMPASSQAPYPSLPAKAESSLIPLLLLTKSNPLRWASIWLPKWGPRWNPAERFRWGEEEQGSVRGATAGRSETKRTLRRRDPRCAGKILPVPTAAGKAPVQIIGGPQGSRVYDVEGSAVTQLAQGGGAGAKTGLYFIGFNRNDGIVGERNTALNASDFRGIDRNQTQNAVFVDLCEGHPVTTELARCITAHYGKTALSRHKGERSGVLCLIGDSLRLGRVRRLMPRECLRLQGFAEDQIDRLLAITSDAQAYKQAGNSVTVNVIESIGRNLRAVDDEIRGADA